MDTSIHQFHEQFIQLGSFWWMIWNAILAIIPAILCSFFFKREDQPRRGIRNVTFSLELMLVLIILPNAPYVATDLVHFLETVRMQDTSLWKLLGKEFPIYIVYVLFGLTCYSFSVDRLIYAIDMRLGKKWKWIALFGIPLLATVGIYLGRVARFNSWDILVDPRGIIHSSRSALDQVKIAKVLISIWFGLIFIHQVYRTFHDGIRVRLKEFRGTAADE